MIDDEYGVDYIFHWQNAGSSWKNFERIKYLRAFLEGVKIELVELEKDSRGNKGLIDQEETLLDTVQREIRRLERKTFYEELGE